MLMVLSATLLAGKNLARPRASSTPAEEEQGAKGAGRVSPVTTVSAQTNLNLVFSRQQQQQEEEEEEEESSSGQPNVIFILVDDVGTNDVGYESTDLWQLTPFMNTLAAEGVILDDYYSNEICTPSRASLMTGRDSFRTGMQFGVVEDSAAWGLPIDEVTLAERFQAAGYSTHMTGKWHLGVYSNANYPFSRGFDTFLGYTGGGEGYYTHRECVTPEFEGGQYTCYQDFGYGDKDGYINFTTNTTRKGPEMTGKYSTTVITDRAIEVAREHVEKSPSDPLFLYVAHQAVHEPLDSPPPGSFTDEEVELLEGLDYSHRERRALASIVYYLDKEVRRLHTALDALGVLDNAVIVFASDNGACPSKGGSNYPLRGFKHTTFQGGVRVPGFVYSKSADLIPEEARGTRYSGMMHSMDWTPTLGSVVPGLPLDEMGKELSGFDQWDAIVGRRSAEEGPVRTELVLGRTSYDFDSDAGEMVKEPLPKGAFIHDGWKLILRQSCALWETTKGDYPNPKTAECDSNDACDSCTNQCDGVVFDFLFHIETDPLETENLAESMPEKYAEMVERFDVATKDEVVPGFKPQDPSGMEAWTKFNNWVVAWH
ncbi:Formylglycine-dependent sulfatase, C-terminal fragment [Ectocarpus siliculosus]|uniref:Formylglycine-dependent sulfatase, C-terminal n=1 Tax=Ectocarpus siliculosus TaxID=2880 RepID=D7FLR5_ECTSI|nr:Formylglycine-dependent sulfatase, C-terminal fragment [Ectocarpus siliculosus]